MKAGFNKHFGFSKGEFNGLLLLIFLIALIRGVPLAYNYYKTFQPAEPTMLAAIQKIQLSAEDTFDNYNRRENFDSKKIVKLFKFDPNSIDVAGWQSLGLSTKQAQSIVNYRDKGGKFYKAEDLQKMYTISPTMYQKLLPYIQIDKTIIGSNYPKKDFHYEKKEYVKKALIIVEINEADSAQLDEVKGIGPAFALRILKYRERIGGFYKKEQLMEVFGLDSVKYDEIKAQLLVNPDAIRKININTATFNDLKSSPYLTYKQMNAILQYKKQHGNFSSAADLLKVAIITPQIVDRIKPYLSF